MEYGRRGGARNSTTTVQTGLALARFLETVGLSYRQTQTDQGWPHDAAKPENARMMAVQSSDCTPVDKRLRLSTLRTVYTMQAVRKDELPRIILQHGTRKVIQQWFSVGS